MNRLQRYKLRFDEKLKNGDVTESQRNDYYDHWEEQDEESMR